MKECVMMECQRCGASVEKRKSRKYCGDQATIGSCSHIMMVEAAKRYKKVLKIKECRGCGRHFETTTYGKDFCGHRHDEKSCLYIESRRKKQEKVRDKKIMRSLMEDIDDCEIKTEVGMTPRIMHLAYVKSHNKKVASDRIRLAIQS